MASNQDLSRGLTKTPTAFAERFKARIAGKIREKQVTPPAPIDELLRLSQERRSRAIAHLAGPATHLTAESPQFHTATPALPPLPATAPLTGPVELSGQDDINQYAVDTSDERDNYEMHRRKSNDLGTAHVDQPDGASNGAPDDASDESQSLEIITHLDDSRLTLNDCVDQPGAHVNQPDEASAIITDQGDSQQLQNARAEYLRTRDIPCGLGHFE
ncbi:hypothetical protein LTR07_001282 [Exophiala xenobiotica]|nr:hypothetical protein LTR79_008774 [Exophiala xenobiotica]KAK5415008.1 hypothetical protein LTR90_006055 [Exophiala xenobiotica]KAK5514383.1 hypothetical protein LTR21_004627 [Exophiala xenobiotica]KAK5525591.1 hypothetical protein LTR07_001282 [Exophiala xenobiotica]